MKTVIAKSPEVTKALGRRLAGFLKKGDVLALVGELGSGKTTFTKGIAEGLAVKDAKYVNSPSFVIIKEYEGKLPLYHFDLYRLEGPEAIETTGYKEYIWGDGVCVIEWAEKMRDLLPKEHIRIEMRFKDRTGRLIRFVPKGSRYKEAVKRV